MKRLLLQKTMLILSMLFLLSTAQIFAGDESSGKMSFKNSTGVEIVVNIYHVSLPAGCTDTKCIIFKSKQKGATIKKDKGKTSTFNSSEKCNDKERGFKVTDTSGQAVTQGYFSFKAYDADGSRYAGCELKVETPTYDDRAVSYVKVKGSKGEFTISQLMIVRPPMLK